MAARKLRESRAHASLPSFHAAISSFSLFILCFVGSFFDLPLQSLNEIKQEGPPEVYESF